MQLYTMDSGYYLKDLIEGYNSLIWTERYRTNGDFELHTPLIAETMAAMPIGSLVSLVDTRVVMMVETFEIKDSDDGKTELTVSGRTFETFLENRMAIGSYLTGLEDSGGNEITWNLGTLTAADAAYNIVREHTRSGAILNPLDAIPGLLVTLNVSEPQDAIDRKIKRGTVYDRLMDVLIEGDMGVRTARPNLAVSRIIVDIYDGVDRSSTIVMDVRSGHMTNARYVFTNLGSVWGVYGASKNTGYEVFPLLDTHDTASGLDRRMGDFTISDFVDPSPTSHRNFTFDHNARVSIASRRPKATLDGTVSVTSPFVYDTDYQMGDIVMVCGEYGVRQALRVIEYIRTEDENGESAYPTVGITNS